MNDQTFSDRSGEGEGVRVLGAAAIRRVLSPAACEAALEDAYRALHAAPEDKGQTIGSQTIGSQTIGFAVQGGKFHVKAGSLPGDAAYFAAKLNGNFPGNAGLGLPTIQGLVLLSDGRNGRPLAILDSPALTGLRTGSAATLAAGFGARSDARRLAIIGAGAQARDLVAAFAARFALDAIVICDTDEGKSEALAAIAAAHAPARSCAHVADAVRDADIVVVATSAQRIVIRSGMLRPGVFLAAIGADSPGKQEIEPAVFRGARVLVDDRDLCAEGGDLAHALKAGCADRAAAASLAELAGGAKPGRVRDDEIVIYDSTGSGLQDVAAAAAAYERAVGAGEGAVVSFA